MNHLGWVCCGSRKAKREMEYNIVLIDLKTKRLREEVGRIRD